MGRLSPSKSYIVVDCNSAPQLHTRFYALKKQTHFLLRRKLTNREFLEYLLNLAEEKIAEVKRRSTVTSY
jgi:hypothetical protein